MLSRLVGLFVVYSDLYDLNFRNILLFPFFFKILSGVSKRAIVAPKTFPGVSVLLSVISVCGHF